MDRFNYRSPFLFTIPLNVYSEEMQRERDKEAFLRIQQLEKKCEQLRQIMLSYTEKHLLRIKTTKYLVWRTQAVNKNMPGRREEEIDS